MDRRTRIELVGGALLLLGALALGAEPTAPRFADRVGTLALDRELDARGRLGGVAVDRLGFVYVANFHDALWRITPEGHVETLTRALYGASGIAVDPRGDLLQASFFGNTIVRVLRTGEVEPFVAEGLAGPVGLVIDDDDNLFVCNCSGNYLSVVSKDGAVRTLARGERFACPNGITFGGDGQLYVTNFNHPDILRVSREGEVEPFVTVPGGVGNAHIAYSKGFFYVTKILANRLFRVSADGEVVPLAGTGAAGHEDGEALAATFQQPNGIAVSPGGERLYVDTVVGRYRGDEPSRISVRVVELASLSKALDAALEQGGVERMAEVYRLYRKDPVRGQEDTVAEMVAYGYGFLRARRMPEAMSVFRLNAEDNPDSAAAQYQLGEAYRYAGQTEAAIAQYRRTLSLDPAHGAAAARLRGLEQAR